MSTRNRDYLSRMRAFVPTPTGQEILEAVAFASDMRQIVPIGGRPGVGKTFALRHFAETHRRTWYCRFSPDTTSVYAVLSEIAETLQLHRLPSQPTPVRRAIVHKLSEAPSLLICDEAQNLSTKGFEEIRSLFDHLEEHCGLGIVFAGHLDLLDLVSALPQLAGRAAGELRIGEAKPADVDALLDAWGFDCAKTRRFLRQFATQRTGLRRIAKAFASAIMLAEAHGAELAPVHIERAWRALGGRTSSGDI